MTTFARFAVAMLLFAGCNRSEPTPQVTVEPATPRPKASRSAAVAAPPKKQLSLVEARQGYVTKLDETQLLDFTKLDPAPNAPPEIFSTVKYKSPVGDLKAYVTPDPKDGKKHPAIVWITGGDCNSIGDVWTDFNPENEQTASAYRKAGIVMMFPSLRGGNDNPGKVESFYGEVDDVIAAAEYVSKLPYVDPQRIYLGGHSTGGTLALLVSECTGRFRAVFSFGPAADLHNYGGDFVTFDVSRSEEYDLRAPWRWLAGIKSPTFVMEGTDEGNDAVLALMRATAKNPQVSFFDVAGATHFSILDPTNRLLAAKITADTGPECNISLTEDELRKPFAR